MRRLLILLVITLGAAVGVDAQQTVSGNVTLPSGAAPSSVKICFTLQNYKPNVPQIVGTGQIVNATNFCINPAANGSYSTSLYGNDVITPSATYWRVDWIRNGLQEASATYIITSSPSPFNLNTATPINTFTPTGINQVTQACFNFTQATPATTWTITHNLNDTNVLVQAYSSGGVLIAPTATGTITVTSATTVTITFGSSQQGNAVVCHPTNVNIATNQPNAVITNPIAPQTINGILKVNGTLGAPNVNSVLWVDGSTYTSLANCYAAIPSSGGVCYVPPNYVETLSANLVLSKNYAGFVFTGPATIIMGSFQITKAGGVNGAFIRGLGSDKQGIGLVYTGSGTAVTMGDNTTLSYGLILENLYLALNGAGTSAVGLDVVRTEDYQVPNLECLSPSSANNQTCMILDGTGSFAGDGIISNPKFFGPPLTGIKFTGTALGAAANSNVVIGGGFPNGCATGGIGLNFDKGSGNTVINMDIETCPTAVAFGNSTAANGNTVSMWNAANTTDVSFGAASFNNTVTALTTNPVVSAGGTGNRVLWQGNYYNTPSAAGTSSIGATTMATPVAATTFRLSGYVTLTTIGTSCVGTTTLTVNVIYTDPNGSGATTTSSAAFNLAVSGNGTVGALPAGASEFPPFLFRAKAGSNVQYSTTYTAGGSCSPGPAYQFYPILEQVN